MKIPPRDEARSELDELFSRPRRRPPPEELEREASRLIAACAAGAVEDVIPTVADRPDLIAVLARRCQREGLWAVAQYLNYLAFPYD